MFPAGQRSLFKSVTTVFHCVKYQIRNGKKQDMQDTAYNKYPNIHTRTPWPTCPQQTRRSETTTDEKWVDENNTVLGRYQRGSQEAAVLSADFKTVKSGVQLQFRWGALYQNRTSRLLKAHIGFHSNDMTFFKQKLSLECCHDSTLQQELWKWAQI